MDPDVEFRAMGTRCRVLVNGPEELAGHARARLADLEDKWSRFKPGSDISRINRAAGRPVLVSPDTRWAVMRAVEAWYLTGGRFDPTILPALVRAGYDRDFARVAPTADLANEAAQPAPGCAEVAIGTGSNTVTVPAGVALDLGGIGKGLAADLIAGELRSRGADGACLDIGGDVRVTGAPAAEDGTGWAIAVADPFNPSRELLRVHLSEGAVVTSTRLLRRWQRGGVEMHHLIDPWTGLPSRAGLASVTVIGGQAAGAEAVAKAAFIAGCVVGPGLIRDAGMTGLLVDDNRQVQILDEANAA